MSFDAEMRSVLESQQNTDAEADKASNQPMSPRPKDLLNDTHETLAPDDEFAETNFLADSVSL
jgi:hypothetical protein